MSRRLSQGKGGKRIHSDSACLRKDRQREREPAARVHATTVGDAQADRQGDGKDRRRTRLCSVSISIRQASGSCESARRVRCGRPSVSLRVCAWTRSRGTEATSARDGGRPRDGTRKKGARRTKKKEKKEDAKKKKSLDIDTQEAPSYRQPIVVWRRPWTRRCGVRSCGTCWR